MPRRKTVKENNNKNNNPKLTAVNEGLKLIKDGMIVGLGSGTTANLFIEELGKKIAKEELNVFGIATSFDSRIMAIKNNIPLLSFDEYCDMIDIAIDGADEVHQKSLTAIKGGGGCHTQEKIIDYNAKELVLLIEESKLTNSLGEKTPVPLEVIPFAYSSVLNELLKMDTAPSVRMAERKMGPVITDNGNMIIDVFINLDNPYEVEQNLNNIPGVVENGIFTKVNKVIVGTNEGKGKILKK